MGPYFRYPETIEELVTDQRWFLAEIKMMTSWAVAATAVLMVLTLCHIGSRERRRMTPQERQEQQELEERLLREEEENKIDVGEAIKNLCKWIKKCLGRLPGADEKTQQTNLRGVETPGEHSESSSASTSSKSSGSRPPTGTRIC